MIYCPKCGTANRRGSRFCNECGELLPAHTMLFCPMCGAVNPVGNAYCDKCNARIIPMAASPSEEPERERGPVKGLSLPTIPLGEGEEQQAGETPREIGAEEKAAEEWLTQLRASAPEEYEELGLTEEVEAEGEEAEDWLAQLRASTPEEAAEHEPEFAAEPVEPVEIPDWLRDLGPIGAEPEAAPREEQPPAETPMETAFPEAAPEEAVPAMPAPAPAEAPDWLLEIAPPEAAPPAAEAVPEEAVPAMPAPAPTEVPDWLLEIAPPEAAPPAAEAVPEEAVPAMPAPAPADIPDWLREVAPPEVAPPPLMDVPPPATPEAPEWLREIAPEEEAAPEPTPSVPPLAGFPAEAETVEVPGWLAELKEGAALPAAPVPPVFEGMPLPSAGPEGEVTGAESLVRAEIPEWLKAMRPRMEGAGAVAEKEPLETEGLLEGLSGVLTSTSAIALSRVRESVVPSEVSEAGLARARLLQSLLTRPAVAPQLEVRRRGISAAERIQRLAIALVLLVPALILIWQQMGQELGLPALPTLVQPAGSAGVDGVHNVIQSIGAGDTVLVAFEYGPVEADELRLVARPILTHLLDRGAVVLVASTRPEGMAMAEGLLNNIAPEEQYTTLGYRPGGATAVAHLLADAGTRSKLILVLAAQPGPLRWWIEQTHAQGEDAPPIVAGVSAALEAAASPYLDVNAGQVEGVVSGLSGAAAYESRYGDLKREATQQLNALAAGHMALVALMLVGVVIYALGGSRKEKK